MLQGNGSGGCKATLIHSATQINGMATLAAVNRMLKTNAGETESSKLYLFINLCLKSGNDATNTLSAYFIHSGLS